MKRIIDTSEAVGTMEAHELCAAADASYDEGAGRLVLELKAFLRPTGLRAKERHFRADWLPTNEVLSETVNLDECSEVTREIFHRWVRKVREPRRSCITSDLDEAR